MQSSFSSSQVNTTQIISSPMGISSQNTVIQSPIKSSPQVSQQQSFSYERECKRICNIRFLYVMMISVLIQFLLMMIFPLFTFNFNYLHPVVWLKEFFSIVVSPLTVLNLIYGYSTLTKLLKTRSYCPTRISTFMKSFGHESLIAVLNLFIGLFTARPFMRCLSDDYKHLTNKSNELNESYSFLLLAGVFMRFYFYLNQKKNNGLNFPIIQQSKIQQMRKEVTSIIKSSFIKSLMPTVHFIGFYIIFGSSFSFFLRNIFFLEVTEKSGFFSNFAVLSDMRLIIYAWMLSSLILSYIQIFNKLTEIFATQSMQFSIAKSNDLTITKALEMKEFSITQNLAAQDLFLLADSANGSRRKEYYALSVPGSHPHNWKQLVKVILAFIDNFTNDLNTNVDYVAKNRRNDATLNILNNPIQKFYEQKHVIRQQNETNGIRSFTSSSPVKTIEYDEEKRSKMLLNLKQFLLRYKIVSFLFGEEESAKLNFLFAQNSQIIIWITQGIAALVARSLEEDSYGVVQYDIKTILKSFIKLRAALEKVSAINTIAKDRNLLAVKSSLRRSIYRITTNFSEYFEDMLIDYEDVRTLHGFISFKEL